MCAWWVENWLDSWSQRVVISDMKSKWQPVINGCPQMLVQSYNSYDVICLLRQLCHILLEALQGWISVIIWPFVPITGDGIHYQQWSDLNLVIMRKLTKTCIFNKNNFSILFKLHFQYYKISLGDQIALEEETTTFLFFLPRLGEFVKSPYSEYTE